MREIEIFAPRWTLVLHSPTMLNKMVSREQKKSRRSVTYIFHQLAE